jgi:hypothetical protein
LIDRLATVKRIVSKGAHPRPLQLIAICSLIDGGSRRRRIVDAAIIVMVCGIPCLHSYRSKGEISRCLSSESGLARWTAFRRKRLILDKTAVESVRRTGALTSSRDALNRKFVAAWETMSLDNIGSRASD